MVFSLSSLPSHSSGLNITLLSNLLNLGWFPFLCIIVFLYHSIFTIYLILLSSCLAVCNSKTGCVWLLTIWSSLPSSATDTKQVGKNSRNIYWINKCVCFFFSLWCIDTIFKCPANLIEKQIYFHLKKNYSSIPLKRNSVQISEFEGECGQETHAVHVNNQCNKKSLKYNNIELDFSKNNCASISPTQISKLKTC